jgi:NDP-sugar pyrophosphorylase family protein
MSGVWADAREITAIIPAGGQTPEGLLPMSRRLNAAMIPAAGRPVVFWTLTYLHQLGIRHVVIGIRDQEELLVDFVRSTFEDRMSIKWVVPDRDGGLGYTVACCAREVETKRALVVLGDTYATFQSAWTSPGGEMPNGSFVLTSPVDESHRWCMVKIRNGVAVEFVDKPDSSSPGSEAIVGVYAFADAPLLRACAEAVVDERFPDSDVEGSAAPASGSRNRIEMSEVLARYGRSDPLATAHPGEWLDCGNPDNLAQAHKRLLQARAFNNVHIDDDLGIFVKKSQQTSKFADEINYYKLLPSKVQVLFPRVVESGIEPGQEFLSLEYYGYPSLQEMWLFENLHVGIWRRVFEHLQRVLTGVMAPYGRPVSAADYKHMYFDKVIERRSQLPEGSELARLMSDPRGAVVNGVAYPSFDNVMERVAAVVPEIAAAGRTAVIHGDMCFSNILYDLRSQICKFIDPRGRFGQAGIFGDQNYDVAKLYHSVHGLYDFIVNDLFTLEHSGNEITLDIKTRAEHVEVQRAFDEVFFPAFDPRHVGVIAGTLFLSMPALHYDAPARQLAMYAVGVELIERALA